MAPALRREWERAIRVAGLKIRFHDLRHVFAVNAVRAGVPLQDLRVLLGHKTLTMVLRYSRHVPGNAAEVAIGRLSRYLERNGQKGAEGGANVAAG